MKKLAKSLFFLLMLNIVVQYWAVIVVIAIIVFLLWIVFKDEFTNSRRKRRTFKSYYDLDRKQPIREFEQKMIEGMDREGKEVFVTAFCNKNKVLRVFASIGSKYKCKPSDNYTKWGKRAKKYGATQIRQYHNHPGLYKGNPSSLDKKTAVYFEKFVGQDVNLKNYIVYRGFLGYKINRYN